VRDNLASIRAPQINVKQSIQATTASTTSVSFADVITRTFTPSSSDSAVMVVFHCQIGNNPSTSTVQFKLVRDSTDIGIGDLRGSRTRATAGRISGNTTFNMPTASMTFIDTSISTISQVTYKLQWRTEVAGVAVYLNRPDNDVNNGDFVSPISTLTCIEVPV